VIAKLLEQAMREAGQQGLALKTSVPSAASTLRESTIAIEIVVVSLRSAMKMFNFPWLRLPEGSETLQGEIRKVFLGHTVLKHPPNLYGGIRSQKKPMI